MSPKFLIYGAMGYTGQIAANLAKSQGLDFIVAARNSAKVDELARSLGVPSLTFDLDDPTALDEVLAEFSLVLNCAGPFMRTARPLIEACIRSKTHYLDIAAELDSYKIAEEKDEEARKAGVMLLPGAGGSVAMLGCLAGFALEQVADPVSIDIALHVAGAMSRGSAISAAENMTEKCLVRSAGALRERGDSDASPTFDFGDGRGEVSTFPVTLPDLITLGKSTGVQDIRTYVNVSGDAFPSGDLSNLPDGPTLEQRTSNPYHASVTIKTRAGETKRAALHTVNGYTFTPTASIEAVRRVLGGEVSLGFQTPVSVFGSRFVESVADSKLLNLP